MLRSELNCNCTDEWAATLCTRCNKCDGCNNYVVKRYDMEKFEFYDLFTFALCSMCAPLSQGAYFSGDNNVIPLHTAAPLPPAAAPPPFFVNRRRLPG